MAQVTHINVTVDFSKKIPNGKQYDLRIPVQLSVKQLIPYLMETLNLEYHLDSNHVIKIPTKNLLLADEDYLNEYPVTDGDLLLIL